MRDVHTRGATNPAPKMQSKGFKKMKIMCKNCKMIISGKKAYIFHKNLCISMNAFQDTLHDLPFIHSRYHSCYLRPKIKRKMRMKKISKPIKLPRKPSGKLSEDSKVRTQQPSLSLKKRRCRNTSGGGNYSSLLRDSSRRDQRSVSKSCHVLGKLSYPSSDRSILGNLSVNTKVGSPGNGSPSKIVPCSDGRKLRRKRRVGEEADGVNQEKQKAKKRGVVNKPSRRRKKGRKPVNYFCKPCDATLLSWHAIRKHLLSSEHLLLASEDRKNQACEFSTSSHIPCRKKRCIDQMDSLSSECSSPKDILMRGLNLMRVPTKQVQVLSPVPSPNCDHDDDTIKSSNASSNIIIAEQELCDPLRCEVERGDIWTQNEHLANGSCMYLDGREVDYSDESWDNYSTVSDCDMSSTDTFLLESRPLQETESNTSALVSLDDFHFQNIGKTSTEGFLQTDWREINDSYQVNGSSIFGSLKKGLYPVNRGAFTIDIDGISFMNGSEMRLKERMNKRNIAHSVGRSSETFSVSPLEPKQIIAGQDTMTAKITSPPGKEFSKSSSSIIRINYDKKTKVKKSKPSSNSQPFEISNMHGTLHQIKDFKSPIDSSTVSKRTLLKQNRVAIEHQKIYSSYVNLGCRCDSFEFLEDFFGSKTQNRRDHTPLGIRSLYNLLKHKANLGQSRRNEFCVSKSQNERLRFIRDVSSHENMLNLLPSSNAPSHLVNISDTPRSRTSETMLRYNYNKFSHNPTSVTVSHDSGSSCKYKKCLLETRSCENVSQHLIDGIEVNFSKVGHCGNKQMKVSVGSPYSFDDNNKNLCSRDRSNIEHLYCWREGSFMPVNEVFIREAKERDCMMNNERFIDLLISRLTGGGLSCCTCNAQIDRHSLVRHIQSTK